MISVVLGQTRACTRGICSLFQECLRLIHPWLLHSMRRRSKMGIRDLCGVRQALPPATCGNLLAFTCHIKSICTLHIRLP